MDDVEVKYEARLKEADVLEAAEGMKVMEESDNEVIHPNVPKVDPLAPALAIEGQSPYNATTATAAETVGTFPTVVVADTEGDPTFH